MSYFQKHLDAKHKLGLYVTLFVVLLPLVRIDNAGFLLFYFQERRFEFFFRTYEVNTASLVVLFLLCAVFVITLLNLTYSRYFCGHLCPKTLLRNLFVEIIEIKWFKILRQKNIQKEELDKHPLKVLFAYLLLALIAFVAPLPFFFYFYPYDLFIEMFLGGFSEHFIVGGFYFAIAVYLFAETLFFKEFFCSYLCPYQLFHSVSVNDQKSFYFFENKENCIECDLCVRVCPVPDLDIKKGFDTCCISCGDCSAVCADIMHKEKKGEALILYKNFDAKKNTTAFFSFASRKLSLVLIVLTCILFVIGVSYLLDQENLHSCRFSNSFLYQLE